MKVKDIQNTKDFLEFLSKHHDFIPQQSEEYSKSICGTGFQSEVLYILPATQDLNTIQNYHNLKFVTINNYKVDRKGFEILKRHKHKFGNVNFLHIWNIKQDDLELLELFPNVTHLLVSYIRKENFSFSGLDHLHKLETLVLSSANKITDFNFLTKSQKEKIKHLDLTYTAKLTKLDGIEDFINLETLTLFASTMESKKTVTLENLNGIDKLINLSDFKIDYFKFDIDELKKKLKPLKNLKQYEVKHQVYENI